MKGLQKHIAEKGEKGITSQEIATIETAIEQLGAINVEVDNIRGDLSEKIRHMNEILNNIKEIYKEKKMIIKGYYPQELWDVYGVPDKR